MLALALVEISACVRQVSFRIALGPPPEHLGGKHRCALMLAGWFLLRSPPLGRIEVASVLSLGFAARLAWLSHAPVASLLGDIALGRHS